MKFAVACDHTGVALKLRLLQVLDERGIAYTDFGTGGEAVDYPIYGEKVGVAVASGEFNRGLVICGTGLGISIAAGKVPGIRVALCSEPYTAKMSREHNDANVLALGARVVGQELAVMILNEWLDAEFAQGGRHQRRVDMLIELDNKYKK